jgi:uncharacterized protein YlxP (DUF503 family)
MFIGIGRFELFMPASGSLKDKRQVLRSVTGAIRTRFNVAIAEVGLQDKWQRAELGVTCVSEGNGHCLQVLGEVERAIARVTAGAGEIVAREVQVFKAEDLY